MNPIARCLLPAVAFLLIGLASAVVPGRAQPTTDVRFAFADTTLLRDTLDLKFDGLFALADSLGMLPDTLRALSIRYDLAIGRLVFMADSLRVPVDSVGTVIDRERFNPLAAPLVQSNDFTYGSVYSIGRQNTSWTNSSDYNLVRGSIFVRNGTRVTITQTRQVGGTAEYRARTSNTEAGWRFSENFSVGGRVNLQRTDNSASNRSIANDDYQLSARFRNQIRKVLETQINAFGGPFGEPNSVPEKRGLGGTVQASVVLRQPLFTHDLNLSLTDKRGRGRQPNRPWQSTHDYTRGLDGTLNLLPSGRAGMRVRYQLQRNHTDRPNLLGGITDYMSRDDSYGNGLQADLRLRDRNDRYVNISGNLSESKGFLELARKDRLIYEPTIAKDRSVKVDGRYDLGGWTMDASFSNGTPTNEGPSLGTVSRTGYTDTTVDYRELDRLHNRSINGSIAKMVMTGLLVRVSGSVTLNSYRYDISDSSYRAFVGDGRVTPTPPREDYRQSYKVEGNYSTTGGLSTGIELEVSRTISRYLVASRSAQNNEDRTYRAVWRWTYRLMKGLTATQRNQMSATYSHPEFTPDQKRLSLSYLTLTTLNAVVTPRLNLDMTFSRNLKPSGDYVPDTDGSPSLYLSDESRDYLLNANLSYRPHRAVSFRINPVYQAIHSDGTSLGQEVPRRRSRTFTLTADASLNIQIAQGARLTGTIGRSLNTAREVRYSSGVPEPGPRSEYDYWTGSLQLSWNP